MFTAIKTKAASALVVFAIAAAAGAPAAGAQEPGTNQTTVVQRDLRSPDTRDAAEGYAPTLEADPIDASGGLDWVSAAIGAAAGTGLMILALALAGTGRRQRVLRI